MLPCQNTSSGHQLAYRIGPFELVQTTSARLLTGPALWKHVILILCELLYIGCQLVSRLGYGCWLWDQDMGPGLFCPMYAFPHMPIMKQCLALSPLALRVVTGIHQEEGLLGGRLCNGLSNEVQLAPPFPPDLLLLLNLLVVYSPHGRVPRVASWQERQDDNILK